MIAIIVVALLIFGPQKLPEIARGLGQGVRTLRNATDEIKREIMKEADEINPVADIKKEIDEVKQGMEGFTDDLNDSVRDIENEEGPISR